jgi:hypothetical protein
MALGLWSGEPMRRHPDFGRPHDEPTAGDKLAVLLFWSIMVIGGGLMIAALLASALKNV